MTYCLFFKQCFQWVLLYVFPVSQFCMASYSITKRESHNVTSSWSADSWSFFSTIAAAIMSSVSNLVQHCRPCYKVKMTWKHHYSWNNNFSTRQLNFNTFKNIIKKVHIKLTTCSKMQVKSKNSFYWISVYLSIQLLNCKVKSNHCDSESQKQNTRTHH